MSGVERIAELVAQVDTLTREIDELRDEFMAEAGSRVAAEAECARLQQVAEAAKPFAQPHDTTFAQYEALREALAGLDTPADSQEECKHASVHFDRSLCACGSMHHYCDHCGRALDCPYDADSQPEDGTA